MANPRLIKKRVGSIKNINKITRALEMVAAAKVQRAQEKAVSAKPFARTIYDLVQTFAAETDPKEVPLLRIPDSISKTLFILVSTNRGLAGSLNTNLFRALLDFSSEKDTEKLFVTIGKKGRNVALQQGTLLADFSEYTPAESAVGPLIKLITESFTKGEVDEVFIVYNDFISALTQRPTIKRILPLTTKELAEEAKTDVMQLTDSDEEKEDFQFTSYNFEPSADVVLSQLLPFYLETQVASTLLEAEASEHSARMVAMKNASDNAQDLTYSLSLEYNKARQSAITTEINDIVTAGSSLKRNEK